MGLPKIQGEVARLWGDVELRFTPAGKAVASVPLVFNKRKLNKSTNEWEDAGSMFVRATAWEQLGENCAESLSKADEVIVTGELSVREYDRKDGTGKGQSIEMNIFLIGPSLARATAKVNKVSRSGGGDFSPPVGSSGTSGAASSDPWGSAPAPSGGQSMDDEIPF